MNTKFKMWLKKSPSTFSPPPRKCNTHVFRVLTGVYFVVDGFVEPIAIVVTKIIHPRASATRISNDNLLRRINTNPLGVASSDPRPPGLRLCGHAIGSLLRKLKARENGAISIDL